jgi:hypothetical protein
MPGTFESVLRADDLLYCQFEFVNLALGTSAAGAPQLTRAAAGDAFIVVRLPGQNIAEQVGTGPFLPYQSGLAGPSRLTFKVPASISEVDYRLDALLALIAGADLVTADALNGLATAIECPDRLLLVPDTSVRLAHRAGAFRSQATHVTELWHTTLRDPANGASGRLRAIANPGDGADRPFTTPLTKRDRDAIRQLSGQNANIAASVLTLTALGAAARLKSDWPPAAPNSNLSLTEWEHQTELGRDRYVRIVEQGYLFPFGHRAAITMLTQRQPALHAGVETAELTQKKFLTVLESERSYKNLDAYPSRGREMPFARVRIAMAPQDLDQTNDPIAVQFLLTDCAGSHIDCDATVFFVSAAEAAGDLSDLRQRYNTMTAPSSSGQPVPVRVVSLGRQRVALAQNDPSAGDTSLNVESVTFGVNLRAELAGPAVPAFLPFMVSADARIPALEQMAGTSANATPASQRGVASIAFHETYLRAGFVPGDKKQVFAKFAAIVDGFAIPPERAGGLAAPKFPHLDGLSRLTGPVAGVEGFVNGSPLDPEALVGQAKLLGVIALKDVIAAIAGGEDAVPLEHVADLFDSVGKTVPFVPRPVITTVANASGIETRFVWKPKIKDDGLPLPLVKSSSDAIELILKGRITAGARSSSSPSVFAVQGTLTNFALSLLGLVTIRFKAVEFASQSGSKVDVKPHVAGVDFLGSLAFVQKLQELLPTTSLGGAPQVQSLPDGVTVSYAIPIPSVPLGVMTIENLALSTAVSLPFVDGKPATVQFAMSQRDNPFQISVSIFGGTGFFSLRAQTDNGLAVEAALEFGGVAELDLVVVKGGVHLLVGVYLSMDSNGKLLIEGHLRFGGYVDVLGLVGISIEFYLALAYDEGRNVLAGTGRLTVGVKLLFHTESFSFEIHREIPGFGATPSMTSAPPMHAALLTAAHAAAAPLAVRAPGMSADQWARYCRAFA